MRSIVELATPEETNSIVKQLNLDDSKSYYVFMRSITVDYLDDSYIEKLEELQQEFGTFNSDQAVSQVMDNLINMKLPKGVVMVGVQDIDKKQVTYGIVNMGEFL